MNKTVGIDGCKGGWMVAVLLGTELSIERHESIETALTGKKDADCILIDIPIGLANNRGEVLHRPDAAVREMLKGKKSSLFPAPLRSVARAKTIAEAWDINRGLDGGASFMTMGIRGAVNEVDIFLQENPTWKNVLYESHPEACFGILNKGGPLLEKKTESTGMEKRLGILMENDISKIAIVEHPLFRKYSDDIIDAVCLALVGRFVAEGKYMTVPNEEKVMADATGIKMRMIFPEI